MHMREIRKGSYIAQKGAVKHEDNPFIPELLEKIRIGNKTVAFAGKATALLVGDDGEVLSDKPVFGFQKPIEREVTWIKLYEDGMRRMYGLPKTATDVLGMLLMAYKSVEKSNPTKVVMSYKHACNEYGYTKAYKTYQTGINSLLANQFIGLTEYQNEYYINPNYFFKGDRYMLCQEYVLRKSNEAKALPAPSPLDSNA